MMLGTHMTAGTTITKLEFIADYFTARRGEAEVQCMLLIGNIRDWRVHREERLRTGGNLRETLRDFLRSESPIYHYDSVYTDAGGPGAAAHLIHTGGAFPYIGLLKEGAWIKFGSIAKRHPSFDRLNVVEVHEPLLAGRTTSKPPGIYPPSHIPIVSKNGTETEIMQKDMTLT